MKERCEWVSNENICIDYHDNQWGKPVFDDNLLFEFLVLESFQAGLSWQTILMKRENFRRAFDDFNLIKISNYNNDKITELLDNKGIIRNKLKIDATINNAKKFIEIQKECDSFSNYIWHFVNHKPIINNWKSNDEIPSKTVLSEKISKDLKQKGFKFVGPTIVYAFMQAIGMVNDHITKCFCHPNNIKK